MNPRRRRHRRMRCQARPAPLPHKVHWSNETDFPNIRTACGRWTSPDVGRSSGVEPYVDMDGALYAFSTSLVTCTKCRAYADERDRRDAEIKAERDREWAAMTEEERAKAIAWRERMKEHR